MRNTALREKFDASPDLQKEFSSFETYQAFTEHDKKGNVKIFDGSKRLKVENPPQTFEGMKMMWEGDESLRSEFGYNFDNYTAFCKNYKASN